MSTCGFQVPTRQRDIGAFQQLPVVSPGCEILGTAVRRAKIVRPTKGMVLLFGAFKRKLDSPNLSALLFLYNVSWIELQAWVCRLR